MISIMKLINREKIHRLSLVLFSGVFFFIASTESALGISVEQRRLFNSGVTHFDIDEDIICSDTTVSLLGGDNVEKIFNYYRARGFSDAQAAAVAGNAIWESGADPSPDGQSSSGNYRGIFHWGVRIEGGPGRWVQLERWAQERGADPWDLQTQLDFSWHETQTMRVRIRLENETIEEGMLRQNTVEHAAWYWGRYFEGAILFRSGPKFHTVNENVQHLRQRQEKSREVLEQYGGGSVGTIPSGQSAADYCSPASAGQFIDNFPIYLQCDSQWGSQTFHSESCRRADGRPRSICSSGCGPTAMAMIVTALTGETVTPDQTTLIARQAGMTTCGSGSSHQVGPAIASHYGLRSEAIGTPNVGNIINHLRQGRLIIAVGAGPAPFTSGGHFIVIRGVTPDGQFLVGDSAGNGIENSARPWDPETIVANMRQGAASNHAIWR